MSLLEDGWHLSILNAQIVKIKEMLEKSAKGQKSEAGQIEKVQDRRSIHFKTRKKAFL